MPSCNTQDYLTQICTDCPETFPLFTDPGCNRLQSKLVTAYLFACGVDYENICPQVEADILDLVTAGQAQKLQVIGDFPTSTPNTVEDAWTCGPDTIVTDYTEEITLRTPYYMNCETNTSNYDFFNQLREGGSIGGIVYATEAGIAFKPVPKGAFSVTNVSHVDEGGTHAIEITISYKTNTLTETYFARGSVFGC